MHTHTYTYTHTHTHTQQPSLSQVLSQPHMYNVSVFFILQSPSHLPNHTLVQVYKIHLSVCRNTHIHHRSRKCGWYWHTHDCRAARRSSLDIWSCMLAADKWSPATASLCLHNLQETGSWTLVETRHIQTDVASQCTGHVCLLRRKKRICCMKCCNTAYQCLTCIIKVSCLFSNVSFFSV